jgi:DNA-directed RNA polymerase subunit RPC12/RpoP
MKTYCAKCKAEREVRDAKPIILENGQPAEEGVCAVCNSRLLVTTHRNACQ